LRQGGRDRSCEGKGCRQRQHRNQRLDRHVSFPFAFVPSLSGGENFGFKGNGVRKNGAGFRARSGQVDKGRGAGSIGIRPRAAY
jgi:hypothetical protein